MGKRKQVQIQEIYEALKCLGHTRLWLRDNGKYNRLIITWDNLVAASYDPYLKSWNFRKNACRVNDNAKNEIPPGKSSVLIELTDPAQAWQQTLVGDW
ncbi:hypothetical protein [Enterobacter sp. JJBC]|uniref:hypothetical protein n=1 Tax=Enterobacter TaxID=547 RepID=UPI0027EEDF86|nr:hypothetical protein [Klebsiella aerogenes]